MGMKVGELFVALGFDVDDKSLNKFNADVKGLTQNMLALIGVTGFSAYGINRFVTKAFDGAQTMKNLAQGTNIAAVELQRYAAVANALNPTLKVEGYANALADFSKKIIDFRTAFGPAPNMRALMGVRLNYDDGREKSAIQVLNELKDAYQGLSDAQINTNLRALGLPEQFLNFMRLPNDQFNVLADKLSLTSHELSNLAEAAKAVNIALARLDVEAQKTLSASIDTPKQLKKNIDELVKSPGGFFQNAFKNIRGWIDGRDKQNKENNSSSIPIPSTTKTSTDKEKLKYLYGLEEKYGLPRGLLDSVYAVESGRGKNLVGPMTKYGRAKGPFQFIDSTAAQYGLKNQFDFNESADAAARYLRDLKKQFGSTIEAVAAYNWGPGNLSNNGIDMAPSETRGYIRNVINNITIHSTASARDLATELSQSYQATITQRNNGAFY